MFYTFTWAPRRQNNRGPRRGDDQTDAGTGDRPRGKGKPKGKPRGPKPDRNRDAKGGGGKAKTYESRPKRDKPIDPDNPFAALAALKDR